MELQSFISETLAAIVGGVVEAQRQLAPLGAHVNPIGLTRTIRAIGENSLWDNKTNNFARNIEFDVALTVEEGTQTKAKIGVLAGIVSASAGGQSENKQLAVSRISFVVPLLLPGSHVAGARKDIEEP